MYQEEDEERMEFMNWDEDDGGEPVEFMDRAEDDSPTVLFGVGLIALLSLAAYGLARAVNDLFGGG